MGVNSVEGIREDPVQRAARPNVLGALSWIRDLAFSILIAVVLIVFIYQPVKVEGTSMEPGLTDNERIFINKFTYKLNLGDVRRGDTVVFWYPRDMSKSYIKRVIGVPGDRIRIVKGQVYVNGAALNEDYVSQRSRDMSTWADGEETTVPPADYFVLGDHRNSSSDSRAWGYVPRENIYGKAVFVYWPLDKMGRVE
ncbi:MAG TPA: signal peptidase I [Bryobacteraceae bacterium]|nr:signal peptidase I [Bryobacteraceae bacterium]